MAKFNINMMWKSAVLTLEVGNTKAHDREHGE